MLHVLLFQSLQIKEVFLLVNIKISLVMYFFHLPSHTFLLIYPARFHFEINGWITMGDASIFSFLLQEAGVILPLKIF